MTVFLCGGQRTVTRRAGKTRSVFASISYNFVYVDVYLEVISFTVLGDWSLTLIAVELFSKLPFCCTTDWESVSNPANTTSLTKFICILHIFFGNSSLDNSIAMIASLYYCTMTFFFDAYSFRNTHYIIY